MGRTKYIFVTGGVVSGLGKGITAASLGRLLKNRGYKVMIQKFDPYINVDPGKLDPCEHGEVFITEDGAETDLDLGHYERFIDENLSQNSSISMGKIYANVIEKEKKGEYNGKTVQVIPHITNEIKQYVYSFQDTDTDIVITEVGGTIGDIEGLSIIEAIRQIGLEQNPEDVMYIHVTLLPYIYGSNEIKTKPTQHSVKELQSFGIKPDIIVCRSETPISENLREKLALFCNVRKTSVIQNLTAGNLYEIPLMLESEGLAREVCEHLKLEKREANNIEWEKMINEIKEVSNKDVVNIAIVGKCVQLEDSYLSVIESIKHASYITNARPQITLINSSEITSNTVYDLLKEMNAIIITEGYSEKENEGIIETIKYARENKVPFLGISLGMQMVLKEAERNSNLEANNIKENPEKCLGARECKLIPNTLIQNVYSRETILERHRNICKYEREFIEKCGMICSGISSDGTTVEVIELSKETHPFFIAVQFHPEFKSRPNKPAPLFVALVEKAKILIGDSPQ